MSTYSDKNGTEHRQGSYRRSRSSHKRSYVLVGLVVLEGLIILGLIVRIIMIETVRADLESQVGKKEMELSELVPQYNKLKHDLDALVINRLPHLSPFEFDKVIAVDTGIVKNIVFTQTGPVTDKHFEYKVVLLNQELTALQPNIDIIYFNEVGVQVGKSKIGGPGSASMGILERGETRAHSAPAILEQKVEPRYFLIQVNKTS